MADIFISYSRRDSEQALALAERLRASGMNVWIDQHGIEADTSWSKEIVAAIKACKAFCLLLSDASIASMNVVKETALASEFKRVIIPIELHEVVLTDDFHYQLAGLQRTSINNIDAILHALAKYKSSGDLNPAETSILPELTASGVTTLRIAVLPFEDQSPAHDNEWFADGLADELILTLNKLDALFVLDKKSSMVYRDAKLSIKQIAHELGVRYVITGSVRKAGDKIRVQATLIDASSGVTLWADKFTGTMDDIFEIQEKTAFDICEGLKLKLTPEEEILLEEKLTTSPEVYELYLQARVLGNIDRNFAEAEKLLLRILELDPKFIPAYYALSIFSSNVYNMSKPKDVKILEKSKEYINKIAELDPNSYFLYSPKANYYLHIGEKELALEMAKKAVQTQPKRWSSYAVLAFIYSQTKHKKEAIQTFIKCIEFDPTILPNYEYVISSCHSIGDKQTIDRIWEKAKREFEARLALYPDDIPTKAMYLRSAQFAGKTDIALSLAEQLLTMPELTSNAYYEISGVFAMIGENEKARTYLRKAIDLGETDFTDTDKTWYMALKGTSEYQYILDHQIQLQ